MQFDVAAFGELVIDLVPVASPQGLVFDAKPGGAPGNVAAGVARLGLAAAMLSKVGDEALGAAVLEALAACGVDTRAVVRARGEKTPLAVVSVAADGERDFTLYRENCADATYAAHEVSLDVVRAARILHVGTLSLAAPTSAAAHRAAMRCALDTGNRISADPNFRPAFWRDRNAMRQAGLELAAAAHILKVSDEELAFLTGIAEIPAAVRSLWHSSLIAVAVTKGPAGADLFTEERRISVPGFTVRAVDTVGCGDAFTAAFLAGLLEAGPGEMGDSALETIGVRACAAGAIIAMSSGAMESMPTRTAIDTFLRSQ
jgi:fructokinase